MTKYPTLADAQAHAGVIHVRLQAGEWEAYEPGDTVPGLTIFQRRDAKWSSIKELRDELSENGGYSVTVGDVKKWFHSDPRSKTRQLALARKADKIEAAGGDLSAQFTGDSGLWKCMDGSWVVMNGYLALAIVNAAEVQDGAIFKAAEAHRAAMKLASNPDAYDFTGGWPETFQG